jgi:hypothetical protein
MTITEYLRRMNRWARWFVYLVMAIGLLAGASAFYFKSVCGIECSWTHGGLVFVICMLLAVAGRSVLTIRFKCPICGATLEPDYGSKGERACSNCPYCAADFSKPMPGVRR